MYLKTGTPLKQYIAYWLYGLYRLSLDVAAQIPQQLAHPPVRRVAVLPACAMAKWMHVRAVQGT